MRLANISDTRESPCYSCGRMWVLGREDIEVYEDPGSRETRYRFECPVCEIKSVVDLKDIPAHLIQDNKE